MRTASLVRRLISYVAVLCFICVQCEAGTLKVTSGVEGCTVAIGGEVKGVTDSNGILIITDVSPGTRALEITKDGYAPYTTTVEVTDLAQVVSIDLLPVAVDSSPNLIVDGNLAGVAVIVNGRTLATTGSDGKATLALPPGSYDIQFKLDGYASPRAVILEVGELSKKLSFTMQPQPGPVRKWTDRELLFSLILTAFAALFAIIVYLVLGDKRTVLFNRRYELREVIGRGGMATVYRAKDRVSRTTVAIKIMDSALVGDFDLLSKFLKEGEVVQALNRKYPGAPIVKVYDFGRESGRSNGRPYIAMEYLAGENLLSYLQSRGKLTLDESQGIILQICAALRAAHEQGIYHRDLTPDNIIIRDERGRNVIRLIDFGIARHEYTSVGTLDGSITGKPPYMSPEQCRGSKVDARSDIYSLGVIFYTLLAGQPPFSAANPLEVMSKHVTEAVPPLPVSVPRYIASVVYRMLAKEPDARYPTVCLLTADLEVIRKAGIAYA